MEPNIKIKILQNIGKVFEEAASSKLTEDLFEKIDNELKELSEYFKSSKTQAFIIAHIFALNYKGNAVDMNDLNRYFDCNPMRLLEFSDDFEILLSNSIIKKRKQPNYYHVQVALGNDQFLINERITEAILKNLPMPDLKIGIFTNVVDVLEKIYTLWKNRDDDEIASVDLFIQTEEIINENIQFPLILIIKQMELKKSNLSLYLYLIWKTICGNEKTDINSAIEGIFDRQSERVFFYQSILTNENELIKLNLIEIEQARFFNNTEVKLSETSITLLQENNINLFSNNKKKENIIEPSKINSKVLFFNNEENKQLDLLKQLLEDTNLKDTQFRLQERNLPKGIVILLYGSPGTGKTETVYQIAKETDREIMKVDISQSKSMWYGESEKIVKKIFTDYKAYTKKCKSTPILLFNEADAILSHRNEFMNSSVDQTENTIQNILLEELENFEGIFFATTNLVNNLDTAFERRFLFKIEFHKPEISIKAKIWRSKLENLNPSDSELLASHFDFSGGQIDNIVRKCEMHEILNGNLVNLEQIIDFCKVEQLSKTNRQKIGYKKN